MQLRKFPTTLDKDSNDIVYKIENPQELMNWRPLSLINTDAKLLTKMLVNRLNLLLSQLINPYETGFMPERLISDNGWTFLALMENAKTENTLSPSAAALLDQEKAYDMVHPFHHLVSALSGLLFGTDISASINGFRGIPLKQQRGLSQGDLISSLLFNLAFEPFLRKLIKTDQLTGLHMAPISSSFSSLLPRKNKRYADDLAVFLSFPSK